jgi:hypothetical protein
MIIHGNGIASRLALALVAVALLVAGCGGPANVGVVTGVVTLDGQPLEDARVTFQPREGSPSAGTTDASGRYELRYTRSVKGAVVGEHEVSISTFRPGNPDAEPRIERQPERVAARYNHKTELQAVVRPGKNQVDFALESSGKVPQPKPGDY